MTDNTSDKIQALFQNLKLLQWLTITLIKKILCSAALYTSFENVFTDSMSRSNAHILIDIKKLARDRGRNSKKRRRILKRERKRQRMSTFINTTMSNVSSMMWRSSPRYHWDIFDDDIRLDSCYNIIKNHLKRSSIYFIEAFLKIVRHWVSYWVLKMIKK